MTIVSADLVIANGLGLEEGLTETLASAARMAPGSWSSRHNSIRSPSAMTPPRGGIHAAR